MTAQAQSPIKIESLAEAKEAHRALEAATARWKEARRALTRDLVKLQRGTVGPDTEDGGGLKPCSYDVGEDDMILTIKGCGNGHSRVYFEPCRRIL